MCVEEATGVVLGVKDCSDGGAAAEQKSAKQAQAAEQPPAPAEEAPVGEQDGAAAKAPAGAAADAAVAAAIAVEKEAEKEAEIAVLKKQIAELKNNAVDLEEDSVSPHPRGDDDHAGRHTRTTCNYCKANWTFKGCRKLSKSEFRAAAFNMFKNEKRSNGRGMRRVEDLIGRPRSTKGLCRSSTWRSTTLVSVLLWKAGTCS